VACRPARPPSIDSKPRRSAPVRSKIPGAARRCFAARCVPSTRRWHAVVDILFPNHFHGQRAAHPALRALGGDQIARGERRLQLIENSAAREGAKLDIRLELESPETLRQLLLSGRIYGLLPYSSIFQDAQARRLGAVPIKGQAMTRYLAKSRNEANSIARETLQKSTIGEMRGLAKRIGIGGQ
jgi:DNA-binding transcriptional LysR family regulator